MNNYKNTIFTNKQIQDLINISLTAGEEIMNIYRNFNPNKDLDYKADNSPVTTADKKSNEIIVNFLQNNYKEWSILSEENTKSFLKETDFFWVIDPLDGTKEFINKNPEFTVNIGLCHKNKPIMGFIYAPAIKEFYYAIKKGYGENYGAFYSNKSIGFNLNNFKIIKVSNRRDNLIMLDSKSHTNIEENEIFLNKKKIKEIVTMGSSLKGCLIAKGDCDIYYRYKLTSKWDTCAMQVICEEAGAIFRQLDDTLMVYKLNDDKYLNDKGFYIINNKENKLL